MPSAPMLPATSPSLTLARSAEPTLGERFVERWGGLLFSIALHLLAMTFLLTRYVQQEPPVPEPQQREIEVSFAQAQPPPPDIVPSEQPVEERVAAATPPMPNERPATSTIANPDKPVLNPVVVAPDTSDKEDRPSQELKTEPEPEAALKPNEAEEPKEAPEQETEPDPADAAQPPDPIADAIELVKEKEEAKLAAEVEPKELTPEEREFIERQKEEARRKLGEFDDKVAAPSTKAQKVILESAAREAFVNTSGAADGVVRTMEFRGVPQPLLNRVLVRNGIETFYQYIDKPTRSTSAISGVRTDDKIYKADDLQPGNYEVMLMTPQAVKKLAQLEIDWLKEKRLKPEDIVLKNVVYGVDRVGEQGYWDLVILRIDYQNLPRRPGAVLEGAEPKP